jgi:hypothetical protein
LIAALVIATPLLLYVHRDIGPWADEWQFIFLHDGWNPGALLRNHNGQLMLVTGIVLNLVKSTFGAVSLWPLAILSVASQLALTVAVFVYCRRHGNEWFALAAAVLILFFGAGWEVIVWSFNFGWLLALAAGITALIVFEDGDGRGSAALASGLLLFGLACSGVATPFVLAIAVYALWKDTRTRSLIVIAAPVLLYGLWTLTYGQDFEQTRNWLGGPKSAWAIASYGFGALLGPGVEFGRAAAVGAAGLVCLALSRRKDLPSSALVALSAPVFFWLVIGINRSTFTPIDGSRYMFTSAVLILLAAAAFTKGVRPQKAGVIALTIVFIFALTANLDELRDGTRLMRDRSASTRAYLSALAIAGPENAKKVKTRDLGVALAGRRNVYQWVTGEGSDQRVAPAAIPALPPPDRVGIDGALIRMTPAAVTPATMPKTAAPVKMLSGSAGAVPTKNGCVVAPADDAIVEVEMGAGGLTIDSDAAVLARPKRFADTFTTGPKAPIPAGVHHFVMPLGAADAPWRVQLTSKAGFTVCGPSK